MFLKNKTVLITGAGGGLGRAIARACAENGANLFLHCRERDKDILAFARQLKEYGGEVKIVGVDLLQSDSIDTLHQAVVSKQYTIGAIDVLINNAGVKSFQKEFPLVTQTNWIWCMNVNARIPFFLCQRFIPDLSVNKGAIVNISSLSGHMPRGRSIDYAMSKAALDIMTRCIAKEYPQVRVNAVSPGYVDTPMVSEKTRSKDPAPYIAKPEEVAQLIMWLLSPDAAHVTGEVIPYIGIHELEDLKVKYSK